MSIKYCDAPRGHKKSSNAHSAAIDDAAIDKTNDYNESHHTITQYSIQDSARGFSCLASTVPDSQNLQPPLEAEAYLKPLEPFAKIAVQSHDHTRRMDTQSSPHDTQELSPSCYENFIRAQKIIETNGRGREESTTNPDELSTQSTAQLQEVDYIDLGLKDPESKESIDARRNNNNDPNNLNSEPIDFSPTQPTQNALTQFPESQRFRTPATHGKKRKYDAAEFETPLLPRNPLARHARPNLGAPALGLSQAFAGTQAGSSPLIVRRVSEPTSDRPSPQIEIQSGPGTASLSSPLRPGSELKKIALEPQSCYKPVRQSQAERESLAERRRVSSDPALGGGQSDGDGFSQIPSAVKYRIRRRERMNQVRQQFENLSSSLRQQSSGTSKLERQKSETENAQNLPHATGSGRNNIDQSIVEDASSPVIELPKHEPRSKNREGEMARIVVRGSSQRSFDEEEDQKDEATLAIHAALQVPETVARLSNDARSKNAPEDSPSLGRSFGGSSHHSATCSETARTMAKPGLGFRLFPTVAVANSQPCPPRSRHITAQPPQQPSTSASRDHVSSSASAALPTRRSLQPASPHGSPVTSPTSNSVVYEPAEKASSQTPRVEVEKERCESGVTDLTRWQRADELTVRQHPPNILNQSKISSRYESANTHVSENGVPAPQNHTSSLSSDQPRKRLKRVTRRSSRVGKLHDLSSEQLSPVLQQPSAAAAITSDASVPASPQRPAIAQCDLPSSATSPSLQPPSSPPISVTNSAGRYLDKLPGTGAQGTPKRLRGAIRNIWDVEVSPPKPVPQSATRKAEQPPKMVSVDINAVRSHATEKMSSDSVAKSKRMAKELERSKDSTPGANKWDDYPQEPGKRPTPTGGIAPNHVFACFNGNPRGYYPARCIGWSRPQAQQSPRFKIKWDDDSEGEVDEHGIRALDVRIGDRVKVDLPGWRRIPYIIRALSRGPTSKGRGRMTDIHGHDFLVLAPKARKSLPDHDSREQIPDVPISAIYLDTNMWARMKKRVVDFDRVFAAYTDPSPIVPTIRSCLPADFDCSSTANTPGPRTKRYPQLATWTVNGQSMTASRLSTVPGIFSNMAFAISHPQDGRKISLAEQIKDNGGTLLENGFHELFEQEDIAAASTTAATALSHASPSAVSCNTESSNTTLKPSFSSLCFVALIADRHSRKLKYLQALSLNLPCLSAKWIDACTAAKSQVDWQPYLLAAGESSELDHAIRSRVLVPPPPTDYQATKTMPQMPRPQAMIKVRPKLFDSNGAGVPGNAVVIVITGTGKVAETRKPYVFLAKMAGARRVEQFPSVEKAKILLERHAGYRKSSSSNNNNENANNVLFWVLVDDKSVASAKATLLPSSTSHRMAVSRRESAAAMHARTVVKTAAPVAASTAIPQKPSKSSSNNNDKQVRKRAKNRRHCQAKWSNDNSNDNADKDNKELKLPLELRHSEKNDAVDVYQGTYEDNHHHHIDDDDNKNITIKVIGHDFLCQSLILGRLVNHI